MAQTDKEIAAQVEKEKVERYIGSHTDPPQGLLAELDAARRAGDKETEELVVAELRRVGHKPQGRSAGRKETAAPTGDGGAGE